MDHGGATSVSPSIATSSWLCIVTGGASPQGSRIFTVHLQCHSALEANISGNVIDNRQRSKAKIHIEFSERYNVSAYPTCIFDVAYRDFSAEKNSDDINI